MSSSELKKIKVKCIRCPKGCDIEVKIHEDGTLEVEGNECPLGKEYAEQEAKMPKRVIFTTVRIKGARYPRLPIRTKEPIPKEKVFEAVLEAKEVEVEAPIEIGEVIIDNVAGTGVPFIAERSMEKVIKIEGNYERK